MRTIRVELEAPLTGENNPVASLFGAAVPKLRISTEVIVGDDADAREAGRDASSTITEFLTGYGEETS